MHVENIYNNRSQNNEIRKIFLQNTAFDIMTTRKGAVYILCLYINSIWYTLKVLIRSFLVHWPILIHFAKKCVCDDFED